MAGLCMKYFVLKPDSPKDHGHQGPKNPEPYAKASRIAIRAYARSIKKHNPDLHKDIMEWVNSIETSVSNCLSDRKSIYKETMKHVKEALKNMTPSQRQAFSRRDGRCD